MHFLQAILRDPDTVDAFNFANGSIGMCHYTLRANGSGGALCKAFCRIAADTKPYLAGNFFFTGARMFFRSMEAAIFLYSRVRCVRVRPQQHLEYLPVRHSRSVARGS